jgi:hypothetical protein
MEKCKQSPFDHTSQLKGDPTPHRLPPAQA